jgi:hypothetical protein
MTYIMVIAIWTIFIAFLISVHIFPKRFSTFFAYKVHFQRFGKFVVRNFCMTFWTVKPLFAARGTDGNLSVENVFTAQLMSKKV